jgi:polygalacturonase
MKFNNWFLPSHSTNGLVFTMKNHNVLILAVAFLFSGQVFGQRYDIRDFGARTDSTFLNTKAIQSAIDQCAGKGGGEVLVPAGTYYTGTIFLKSNVFLHLSAGAVLQGSYNPADYPEHTILSAKNLGPSRTTACIWTT